MKPLTLRDIRYIAKHSLKARGAGDVARILKPIERDYSLCGTEPAANQQALDYWTFKWNGDDWELIG